MRSVEKINDEQERNKRLAYPLGCIVRNDKISPKLLIRIMNDSKSILDVLNIIGSERADDSVLEEAYNWLLRSVEKINDEQERNKRIAYPLGCIIRNDKTSPKLLIRIINDSKSILGVLNIIGSERADDSVLEEAYNWLLRSVEKINDEQERNKRIAYPLGCIVRNDKTSPKLLIRIINGTKSIDVIVGVFRAKNATKDVFIEIKKWLNIQSYSYTTFKFLVGVDIEDFVLGKTGGAQKR